MKNAKYEMYHSAFYKSLYFLSEIIVVYRVNDVSQIRHLLYFNFVVFEYIFVPMCLRHRIFGPISGNHIEIHHFKSILGDEKIQGF